MNKTTDETVVNESKAQTIHCCNAYSIHSIAGQYIYNMPCREWLVCWVIACDSCNFFSGFPAEIRHVIMDHYLGASTGTGNSILGVYLAVRTGQIYWWEPYIYMFNSIQEQHTLEENNIVVSEEIILANRSASLCLLCSKVMRARIFDVKFYLQKYDILVALRDKVLTHPQAIGLTNKMIAYWDQLRARKAQK